MPYCILLPARLPYGILLQEENLVAIFDKALATTFFSNLRFFQAYTVILQMSIGGNLLSF